MPSPAAASAASSTPLRSPITTHALDTALGTPAQGLPLSLHKAVEGTAAAAGGGGWVQLAAGVTDADGRVGNLLPPSDYIAPGRRARS